MLAFIRSPGWFSQACSGWSCEETEEAVEGGDV